MAEPVRPRRATTTDDVQATTPEAETWLAQTQAEADSGELFRHPPIREQIAEQRKRHGLR